MPSHLPRVTYSIPGNRFSVHDRLDQLIPSFEAGALGRTWATDSPVGQSHSALSPIDGALFLGGFPTSTDSDVTAAIAAANAAHAEWSACSLADRLDFGAALGSKRWKPTSTILHWRPFTRLQIAPRAVRRSEECLDWWAYYRGEIELRHGFAQTMNELGLRKKPPGAFASLRRLRRDLALQLPLALSVNMICGALLTGRYGGIQAISGLRADRLDARRTLNAAGLPQGVFTLCLVDLSWAKPSCPSADVDGIAFTGSYKTGMASSGNWSRRTHSSR